MESPRTVESGSRSSGRTSVIESIRGCTLAGARIHKEELRRRITMPEYVRVAMREAIQTKDLDSVKRHFDSTHSEGAEQAEPPESPLVVFINSKSGGRHGPELKARLEELMGEEQVFDLQAVKPHEFVQYGLSCLEKFAGLGDICAKEIREKLRIVVAGGDGTVGWVLGCLGELHAMGREPVPPTGIVPLGTGNDLSRSFGWGGSFPFNWKSAIKRILDRVTSAPLCRLDSWKLVISMPAGEELEAPHSLKSVEDSTLDQELEIEGPLPEKQSYYEGVFYNYFSIGMDAQVAYGFHHLRNEKPYLAQGPLSNKLIYSGYSCKQGWFFTPCSSDPGLRGLKNILRIYVKKVNSSKWDQIPVPSSVRSIVALNLPSYGSGRNPWGHLKPDYLEKRGFVEATADDGLLEIFGLKQGWHASMVMVELISAKHIAQASAIRFELRGGEWKEGYMQMDGEPWKQPMDKEFSTFIEIKRVPFQSVMIHGDT
ncbi:diacylglycerol kinase 7-like [Ipomoea triloba]|uniref:diacylglycerol kinase 7-like n=1 Tax=Ipomoea triloba TaxID=35885 RepID=UPI00125D7D29|nr:diacylglycerol kinase 7-like [Ipomoea triloba]XP_031097806.1 diacylglycerol kinase 7-like [Ipomoea triloba]XP_031097807.1 diacylglycerol kinase 7-like [Ipomoea triloba]